MIPVGLYRGSVEGSESGHCEARIVVAAIPGGVAVDYEAVGAAGLQHVEHTLVMPGRLFVAHSESPVVTVFDDMGDGVYLANPDDAGYLMQIAIGRNGRILTWAWSWGPIGADIAEQSKATVSLV